MQMKFMRSFFFDAAYEAYITEENIPHSIYECEGAKTCAIEMRSFSKNAGFTGLRLGYTVVPKELVSNGVSLNDLWLRRHGTKYNGAPYIVQRAGEAVYSEVGKAQIKEQIAYYMENARQIREGLIAAGYQAFGGVNSPYVWLKTPDNLTSWEFFDKLFKRSTGSRHARLRIRRKRRRVFPPDWLQPMKIQKKRSNGFRL